MEIHREAWISTPGEQGFQRFSVETQPAEKAPLGLALGSPIFPSGCEGQLGVALESLQGRRDLT